MTPLPLIAAAFVVGTLATQPDAPEALGWTVLGLAGVGAWLGRKGKLGAGLILLTAAALTGAVRGKEIPAAVPRPRLHAEGGLLSGRVIEGCFDETEGTRCLVITEDGRRVVLRTPRTGCAARPGDVIAAVATLVPVAPDVNGVRWGPGEALARRGIQSVASAAGCERIGVQRSVMDHARRVGWWVRAWLGQGLDRSLDPSAAQQARALLFGDTAHLDPEDVQAFRETGLAHLLAVSGAHVALLAALLGGVVRALTRRVEVLATRGWVVPLSVVVPLPALVVFVLATGESASAVRALVGAMLGAMAALAGRRVHGESVVAASAMITLAVMPSLVTDAGWQLSVVAAWALTVAPQERPAVLASPTLWRSVVLFWREGLEASVRVAIAVAPVLAWHFQRTPATAIVANAFAAPLAEAIALPLVLVTGVTGALLPAAGGMLGTIVGPVLSTLFAVPRVALALPWAAMTVPPPTPVQAVVMVLAALVALRARGRGRVAMVMCTLVVVAGLEVWHRCRVHPRGVLRVTALDVGQGDAILVDLPDGTAMLVDAGGGRGIDPGRRVVVPVLADRRRRSLAVVVASHPHPDHVGGIPAVLEWAEVGELWDTRQGERSTSESYARMRAVARARGVVVRGPEELCGPRRAFHGVWLEVLEPCPAVRPGDSPNDASLVLRLTFGRASVLLPGDLERVGEARVLSRLVPVTLLKVGHHGSRTSSTPEFLAALAPRVALVSAGHPSEFGHPHSEVVDRFRARGIPLWSTAEHGAVAVTLRADGSFTVSHGSALGE